jgi:streptogramin lyase
MDLTTRIRETLEGIEPAGGGYLNTLRRVRRQRWRRRYGMLGLALVLVFAATVGLTLLPGSHSAKAQLDVGLPGRPLATAREGDSLWVLTCKVRCSGESRNSVDLLIRIDARNGKVILSNTLDGATALAAGEGAVWVADFWNSTVSRIDPVTGEVVAVIPLRLPEPIVTSTGTYDEFLPQDLAAGEGGVWVSTARGYVAHVDPDTNTVSAMIKVEGDAAGPIVAGAGAVWLGESQLGVLRIDPSGNLTRLIPIAGEAGRRLNVASLALSGSTLWATGDWAKPSILLPSGHPDYTTTDEHAAVAVDTDTGAVSSVTPLDERASSSVSANGTLWLSGKGAPTVYRFNTAARRVVGEIRVHGKGTLVAAADHAVWVTMSPRILRRLQQ